MAELTAALEKFLMNLRHYHQQVTTTAMMGQAKIIMILAQHPGLPQRELAERAKIRPASVSEALERLEKQALIEKQRDAQDRRMIRVHLTARGQARAVEMKDQHAKYFTELLSPLTPQERETMAIGLQKINRQLEQMMEESTDK